MMKIKRKIAAALVGVLASFGLFAPMPARASFADCAAYEGTICFTEFPNFTGQIWRQFPWQIAGGSGCRNFGPDGFDNEASTAFNNIEHSYSVRIWQYPNCTGESLILVSGSYYVFSGYWWNDKASSVEVTAA
jgi:hypothetical protein